MTAVAEKRGRGRPKGNRGTRRSIQNITPELIKTLESRLEDDGDCRVYQGKPTPTGHATFYYDKEIQGSAHRVAYEIWKGPIPVGGYVLQTCSNKLCCKPEHLYLGTFKDVMKIRNDAGRTIKGSRNPKAKLTPAQVMQIRERALKGEKLKPLALEFGVSQSTISQIKKRNIWEDV